jgi:MoxR-like ATPase
MVMATQNPIEQEGTYPLPEAQLDRFLLHVLVDYPNREAETKILQLVRTETSENTAPSLTLITQQNIFTARQEMLALHMAEPVERYIVELILATRSPPERIKPWLEFGASPRGTIGLDMCSRALAWLQNRDFVTPEDVQNVAHDVLRHRLILSFDADAQGITTDQVIDELIALVPVP